MTEYKKATPVQMAQIATEGDAREFNRQIAEEVIADLDPKSVLLVSPLLIHEHAQGQRVEPHLRARVTFRLKNGVQGSAVVDMSLESFESLAKIKSRDFRANGMTTAQRHRFRSLQRAFREVQLWVGWADSVPETENDLIVEDDHPEWSDSIDECDDLLHYVVDGDGTPKKLAAEYASRLRQETPTALTN